MPHFVRAEYSVSRSTGGPDARAPSVRFAFSPWAFVTAAALSAATLGGRPRRFPTDWPQWRGPERTGISRETGLLKQWPASGPPALWSATGLGAGYGSVAVKGTRVFVQGLKGRDSVVHQPRPGRRQGAVDAPIGPGRTTTAARDRAAPRPWTATACSS